MCRGVLDLAGLSHDEREDEVAFRHVARRGLVVVADAGRLHLSTVLQDRLERRSAFTRRPLATGEEDAYRRFTFHRLSTLFLHGDRAGAIDDGEVGCQCVVAVHCVHGSRVELEFSCRYAHDCVDVKRTAGIGEVEVLSVAVELDPTEELFQTEPADVLSVGVRDEHENGDERASDSVHCVTLQGQ